MYPAGAVFRGANFVAQIKGLLRRIRKAQRNRYKKTGTHNYKVLWEKYGTNRMICRIAKRLFRNVETDAI
jgi:hypothetical protein